MAAKSFVRRARRAAAENELPFWKRKTLAQMTQQEWESLCDGCGMCCTNKLEYEGTGEIVQTDTCCKLLDPKTAHCRDYKNRKKIVPDCIQLTPKVVAKMDWLPQDLRLPAGPFQAGPLLVAPADLGRPGNRAPGGHLGPGTGDSGGPGRGHHRAGGGLAALRVQRPLARAARQAYDDIAWSTTRESYPRLDAALGQQDRSGDADADRARPSSARIELASHVRGRAGVRRRGGGHSFERRSLARSATDQAAP